MQMHHCSTCEKERPFKTFPQYRYAHLYYLRWVTRKQYHLACDVCRRGWELASDEVEAKLTANPIPFMTRFGWAFLVGGIAVLFVFAALPK